MVTTCSIEASVMRRPIDHMAFNTQLCCYIGGRAASAMNQYLQPWNGTEPIQEFCQGTWLLYNLTSNLDDCEFFHFIPSKYIRTDLHDSWK